ncbi:MAG: FecR domain-containing protein [Adhaeribacter sp.]
MKYQDFQVKDFILDELFQQWVLEQDAQAGLFWEEWLLRHPEKQQAVARARTAILELHLAGIRKEQARRKETPVTASSLTAEDLRDSWQNISAAIRQPLPQAATQVDTPQADTRVIPIFRYTAWAKIAASILLILAIGALYWMRQQTAPPMEQLTFATAFGETKEVRLPDKSRVFLNANSRLSMPRHWQAGADRKVKLEGEAFFAVQHTRNQQKFIVSLINGSRVEVLGTEFTVTDRPSLSRIVLSKGKVKVAAGSSHQPSAPSGGVREAVMAPGELVLINHRQGTLAKTPVSNPAQFAAFTKEMVEFNNSLLSEVARVLQDHYGYQVTFQPASLAHKRFTSSTAINRVDLLLFAIEKSFNLKVVQKGKHLTIKVK